MLCAFPVAGRLAALALLTSLTSALMRDYSPVASALSALFTSNPAHAPLFVRLAWHQSGTYNLSTRIGGPSNASIRFPPESADHHNAGLAAALVLLNPIKRAAPNISWADLIALSGVIAVQDLRGPSIAWREGRADQRVGPSVVPPDSLPDAEDASAGPIRAAFARMGFTADAQVVALIGGGHSVGRGHTELSGYSGAWTVLPTRFTNGFFTELLTQTWLPSRSPGGKLQFTDAASRRLMMLPSDLALLRDAEYRAWCARFSANQTLFFGHFAAAFKALLELGVAFPPGTRTLRFVKPSAAARPGARGGVQAGGRRV